MTARRPVPPAPPETGGNAAISSSASTGSDRSAGSPFRQIRQACSCSSKAGPNRSEAGGEHIAHRGAPNGDGGDAGGLAHGSEESQGRHTMSVEVAAAGGTAGAVGSPVSSPVVTRLLLLRHAESEWNAQGRWQGQADTPLTERGRRHAAEAGPLLATFEMLVSSDLRRARQSAEIIAAGAGITPRSPPSRAFASGTRDRGRD